MSPDDSAGAIAEVAAAVFADDLDGHTEVGWDASTWTALSTAGLTSIELPEAAGGGGGSVREAAEVVRAAGAAAARLPIAETLLVPWLLSRLGLAMPPGVVAAADARTTARAERDSGGRWLLTGSARRVPFARHADSVVLLVDGDGGAVVVVVPGADVGLVEHATLAGDPADDLELPGVIAQGAAVDARTVETFTLRTAVGRLLLMSGAAAQALELTLRQVSDREQFGRAIGRFQVVQHLVAELAGEVAAVQIGTDAALLALQSGSPGAWIAVAAAKIDADRSVTRLTALAHQLHGAVGVTHEHALRRFTLRLWAWRDEAGTAAVWSGALAARLLDQDGPPLWTQLTR